MEVDPVCVDLVFDAQRYENFVHRLSADIFLPVGQFFEPFEQSTHLLLIIVNHVFFTTFQHPMSRL